MPLLGGEKCQHRDEKAAQEHAAGQWQSWGSKAGGPAAEATSQPQFQLPCTSLGSLTCFAPKLLIKFSCHSDIFLSFLQNIYGFPPLHLLS